MVLGTPIKIEQPDSADDPIPVLKKMPVRRGRRQKRRGFSSAIKPVLSPAKIRQPAESSNAVEFNIGNIDEVLNIRSNETALSNVKRRG